jgi:hypothetical protein
MTIYNIGSNYYLGNVKFGTFNVAYPSIPYLEAFPHNAISAKISALCTAAGLPFRNVLPQASFDAFTQQKTLLAFGSQGDIDDRYVFDIFDFLSTGGTYNSGSKIYNDAGYTLTNNGVSSTNLLATATQVANGFFNRGLDLVNPALDTTVSSIQWFGCANANELALGCYQHRFATNQKVLTVFYAGKMSNVPTDFNYYSASNITKSMAIMSYQSDVGPGDHTMGKHYIASTAKDVLKTGFAEYATEGSTTQWAKGLGFFDNNTTLGFPTMGKSNILRVLEGTYTIGKPANITGGNPSLKYIPLGLWTPNRQLALEVYSA